MPENVCHCGRKRADHRLSVWQPVWGEHHKFKNTRSQTPYLPMKAQNLGSEAEMLRWRNKQEPTLWQFEQKVDGMRCILELQKDKTLLWSRTGLPLNDTFPELTLTHMHFDQPMILDGEIVTIPESLDTLQMRMGLTKPEDVIPHTQTHPVQVVLFDMLEDSGDPLLDFPLSTRRGMLEEANNDARRLSRILTVQELDEVIERGGEGWVAKRALSSYQPNKRRADWKKYKRFATADLVITGTKPGKGQKEGRIGSFEVSYYDHQQQALVYTGNVGAGLITEERLKLERMVEQQPLGTVVVEVQFMGKVKTGLMREPKLLAIRYDKRPEECDGRS